MVSLRVEPLLPPTGWLHSSSLLERWAVAIVECHSNRWRGAKVAQSNGKSPSRTESARAGHMAPVGCLTGGGAERVRPTGLDDYTSMT